MQTSLPGLKPTQCPSGVLWGYDKFTYNRQYIHQPANSLTTMEFVILGFFTALGKYIILWKLIGMPKILRIEKWVDLFFTIFLPMLFAGTFSGCLLAIFSGLWLSLMLRCTALFVKPAPSLFTWKSKSTQRRN